MRRLAACAVWTPRGFPNLQATSCALRAWSTQATLPGFYLRNARGFGVFDGLIMV